MCKQGQKKVPRQDTCLELSFSRESLDSGRESPVELEHCKQETQNEAEATGLDSALGDELVRDCDNATTVSELESNGCTEDSIDLEASQNQRDRICLEPIYDLYAISVSSYTLVLHSKLLSNKILAWTLHVGMVHINGALAEVRSC